MTEVQKSTKESKGMEMSRRKARIPAALAALLALLLATGMTVSCDRFGGGSSEGQASEESGKQAQDSGGRSGNGQASQQQEESIFAVSTTEAVLGQLKDYIEVNGDVVSKTTVQAFPDAAGKLSKIYIDLGDRVRKDQVIAEVDPSKPGMQFESSPVKSPISGTVTNLPVQEGSTVSQQMSVAQISKMDELQIRTDVAERFISDIEVGLRAVISSDAYPERVYNGRIAEVSPVVDPQSRMMEVKINFTDGSEGLKSGMFVEAKIVTKEKENVVKLPVDCVVERFGEDYVFVVEDAAAEESQEGQSQEGRKTVSKRNVSTGIEIDRKVEILKGLEVGEQVVYRGQTLLEEGSQVKVVSRVEPLSSEDVLE